LALIEIKQQEKQAIRNTSDPFFTGLTLKAEGLEAKHPVIMVWGKLLIPELANLTSRSQESYQRDWKAGEPKRGAGGIFENVYGVLGLCCGQW
jgi:hypothetical protein